ncbi:hypothetical protein BBW65_02180 [Helicobacter enhydrae]|uniref:Beta-lactamase n=1 Tax=Helicobacter enhydrae TaxID=222136 RepID=A0A1B1U4R6_9HELI|nr:tetratricopeptide repeat protein [Helicobacter enhydrae]ANV97685.1 hypothetical protein BBW65_02180 [Helicobacter enhydrae]
MKKIALFLWITLLPPILLAQDAPIDVQTLESIQEEQEVSQTQETPQDPPAPQTSTEKPNKYKPSLIDSAEELALKSEQCLKGRVSKSCFEVGYTYYNTPSATKELYEYASSFLLYSCKSELALGCYEVGIMSASGVGLKKNYPYALEVLQRACDNGDLRGCRNLGVMYFHGWGTQQDIYKAIELFHTGCQKKDDRSCESYFMAMGIVFQKAQNLIGAQERFEKACELGNKKGCQKSEAIKQARQELFYENVVESQTLKEITQMSEFPHKRIKNRFYK